MKKLLPAAALLLAAAALLLRGKTITREFAAGGKPATNPDRGFYLQVTGDDPDVIGENEGVTRLFLIAFDLCDCRGAPIPEEKLAALDCFLSEAEERGACCIFRAAYGFEDTGDNDADGLERIAEHISQLAPVLNRHKGRLTCVQAGFYGPWGEWHDSAFLEEDAAQNRVWLLRELLGSLDAEIVVDVRRPRFIREAAAAGLPVERLGFHDDGLLASADDLGTYDDPDYSRDGELRWLAENLATGANGGEMPAVSAFSDAENAVREFRAMKLSYLNLEYGSDVYAQWKGQTIEGENAFSYIAERLGYRLYVSEVSYPRWRAGAVAATLRNDGFAPPGSGCTLEWAVEDEAGHVAYSEASRDLSGLEGDAALTVELPAQLLREAGSGWIGLRISRADCCLELANDGFTYCGGVNYFLRFDARGVGII